MINFICDICGQPIMVDVPALVYDGYEKPFNMISHEEWLKSVQERTGCTYKFKADTLVPSINMYCPRCAAKIMWEDSKND